MGTRIHGWPEQGYAVLLQLSGEPSRETRERLRRDRERHVRQPMIDLLNDLAADSRFLAFTGHLQLSELQLIAHQQLMQLLRAGPRQFPGVPRN